ncbi:DUF1491 family protein [Asaia siamensis]|uniref:DUF1491 family protein n=1 Tax=Asaia siamensis TaxID=110479 RepID=A0ABQ1M5G0_9PROT|nr:DUF1491 family protein [Asaia siamensis]GBR06136.1 hypothetical protein AA0323_1283 [Asaia siamensis NRIC 0323]GGC35051.1 hypothetical protein GCM10007207_20700 [Asaia siamensis]
MTEARLKSGLWARGLMRLIETQGGSAMMLKRGDDDAGAVLIVLTDRTGSSAVLRDSALGAGWERIPMETPEALDTYLERQKRYDPDLWLLEFTLDDIATPVETFLPGRSE